MTMKYDIVTLQLFPAIVLSRGWQIYESMTIRNDTLGLKWETLYLVSFENWVPKVPR